MMDMAQTYLDEIRRRREEILERVDIALDHAGRHREDLKIMAVSKTVDIDAAADAVRAGYTLLGENRPQELVRKFEGLRAIENLPEYRLDMIGNLQKNKINAVLGHAGLILSSRPHWRVRYPSAPPAALRRGSCLPRSTCSWKLT